VDKLSKAEFLGKRYAALMRLEGADLAASCDEEDLDPLTEEDLNYLTAEERVRAEALRRQ